MNIVFVLVVLALLYHVVRRDRCIDRQPAMTTIINDSKLLHEIQSQFQKIKVYDSVVFGRILTIDGDIQLSDSDEAHYHEMLVHVPMAYGSAWERILIVGGGDGGALRECCKYPFVKSIVLVDIDLEVLNVCQKYFPKMASGFSDPRVQVVIQDAAEYVRTIDDAAFDVVLVDITDFGQSQSIVTPQVARHLRRVVDKRGLLAMNFESVGVGMPPPYEMLRNSVWHNLFRHERLYQSFQPIFTGGHYLFAIFSDTQDPLDFPTNWHTFFTTEYYTPDVHKGSFALPAKYLPSAT